MFVFAFLFALVDLNVFEEIYMSFLLVGHTGNAVDQVSMKAYVQHDLWLRLHCEHSDR